MAKPATGKIDDRHRAEILAAASLLFTGEPQSFGLPLLADRHWDPIWAAAQDCGLPVSFHIGSGDLGDGFSDDRVASRRDRKLRGNLRSGRRKDLHGQQRPCPRPPMRRKTGASMSMIQTESKPGCYTASGESRPDEYIPDFERMLDAGINVVTTSLPSVQASTWAPPDAPGGGCARRRARRGSP